MMRAMSLGVGHCHGTSVLVSRAEELAALDGAFERVREGGPAAVLIGGEAGIGKSRLIGEFGVRARAGGVTRVLSGCCLELSAEGLPFAPFTEVLRELVRDLGADGVAGLLPEGTRRTWLGWSPSSGAEHSGRRR